MTLLMGTKRQFKMNLDEDLIERLKAAAERLGRDSGQEVVEEIISVYFPVWLAVSDSARRAVDFQARLMNDRFAADNQKAGKAIRRSLGIDTESEIVAITEDEPIGKPERSIKRKVK